MTILTLGAGGLYIGLAQLDDALVGVVADNAVQRDMLALKELLVLFVVLDKAALGVDPLGCPAQVALAALLRVAVDLHTHAVRVGNVHAARTVALLALDTGFSPCAYETR